MPRPHPPEVKLLDRLLALLLMLSLIGYPLISAIPVMFDMESRLVSVPYRIGVVGLSLLAVLLAAIQRRRIHLPTPVIVGLLLAFTVLAVRYGHDVVMRGVEPHPVLAGGEYLSLFIGLTLLPSIPLVFAASPAALVGMQTVMLPATCLAVGLGAYSTFFEQTVIDLAARSQAVTLNAISFANLGAVLVLLAATLGTPGRGAVTRLLRGPAAAAGAAVVVVSASKGPMLALVVTLAVWHYQRSRNKRVALGQLAVATVALALAGIAGFVVAGDSVELAIVSRILEVGTDSSVLERSEILRASWNVFAEHPMLGGSISEPVSKSYPHNVVLEALMVGGIGFGLLELAILAAGAWCSFRLMRMQGPLAFVGAIGLYFLTMSMTSGSLYLGPETWQALIAALAYGFTFGRSRPEPRRHAGWPQPAMPPGRA